MVQKPGAIVISRPSRMRGVNGFQDLEGEQE